MDYMRTTFGRKRYKPTRRKRKRLPAPQSTFDRGLAQHMRVLENKVRRKLVGETKYVDGFFNIGDIHTLSNTVDDTWVDTELDPNSDSATVIGCMPIPKPGDKFNNRDGRKIVCKKLRIWGHIQWQPKDAVTAGASLGMARIVVYKDTSCDGNQSQGEEVIGPGLTGIDVPLSGDGCAIHLPTAPDGWGRFRVLLDRKYVRPQTNGFNDGSDGAVNGCSTPFQFDIDLKDTVMSFSASDAVIADVVDNAFHMIGAATGEATAPKITYYCRMSFVG